MFKDINYFKRTRTPSFLEEYFKNQKGRRTQNYNNPALSSLKYL